MFLPKFESMVYQNKIKKKKKFILVHQHIKNMISNEFKLFKLQIS